MEVRSVIPRRETMNLTIIAVNYIVSQFIQKHFKGVDAKPAVMEFCMLTLTVSQMCTWSG